MEALSFRGFFAHVSWHGRPHPRSYGCLMSTNPTPSGPTSGSASHAALFAAIFEHALDAIFLIDDSMRYVDANPAACALGYTATKSAN